MPADEQNDQSRMTDTLMALVLEADEFPSPEQAKEILRENKIDLSDVESRVKQKLSGLRARQKLAAAKERRKTCLESLARCSKAVTGEFAELREQVLAKLNVLASSDPDTAMVYCRRFEHAPDEDLPGIEADLAMLDILEDEDGESDQS